MRAKVRKAKFLTVICFGVSSSPLSMPLAVVDNEIFERRISFGVCKFWEGEHSNEPNFWSNRSPTLQTTIRHSLFAICCLFRSADLPTSRFADKFGSAEALPSQLVHRLKSVSTETKPAKAG